MISSYSGKSNLLFMSFRWNSFSHWYKLLPYSPFEWFTALVWFFVKTVAAQMTAFVLSKFYILKRQKLYYSQYMMLMIFCISWRLLFYFIFLFFLLFFPIMLGQFTSLGATRLIILFVYCSFSLAKKDPARNLVGKDRFLVLMNGYFLPRNLTACGKGLLSLIKYSFLLVHLYTNFFLMRQYCQIHLQFNFWVWSQAKASEICCQCFVIHWKGCWSIPCVMESVRRNYFCS